MSKKYISNKNESVRMFENDTLEKLSRTHWSVPLIIFVPVLLYFLYQAIFVYAISAISIVLYLLLGVITWSFIEYLLHRFVFHYNFKSKIGKRVHFLFHGVHHDYPNDAKRLVMPPLVSIPMAALFYVSFTALLGPVIAAPFLSGLAIGYLFYDMTHYAVHHAKIRNKF